MKNPIKLFISGIALSAAAISSIAQTAVNVGSGSYASCIPDHETEFWAGYAIPVKKYHDTCSIMRMPNDSRPVPTNDWWQALLFYNCVQREYSLWAQPLKLAVEPYGLGFFYAQNWSAPSGGIDNENIYWQAPSDPVRISAAEFTAVEQRVLNWGDWTVQFRVLQSSDAFMDVTIGHGMPYAWVEYHGLATPQVGFGVGVSFFNDAGTSVTLPYTGDHIGAAWNGRNYGIFAPAGTEFSLSGTTLNLKVLDSKSFVTVAALPGADALSEFYRYAYAVPRNSQVTFRYNAGAGFVRTNWRLETELLKNGADHDVIQGWIPHHWRHTARNFNFNSMQYYTARGLMKCAAGVDFRIDYPFNGLLAELPEPQVIAGVSNAYDPKRMSDFINAFDQGNIYTNAETYAGGKIVTMMARQLVLAHATKHPAFDNIRKTLRMELENCFTYTPSETEKYYAYSDRFHGLIGFNCGFGTHRFNDQHFHYGYYVYAASVLAMYDRDFREKFGPMAQLVAKEYANWDRADERFPFFRTLDIWEGHSWASGMESCTMNGNNQESSSEAMCSWAGALQLGVVLNDSAMIAGAAFGYAIEAEGTNEYWFDRYDENIPTSYGPPGRIACLVWG